MKKNIEHVWSIVCIGSSIDQETNNVTAFNIIEQLTIPQQMFEQAKTNGKLQIQFELIDLWSKLLFGETMNIDVQINIVDPNFKKVGSISQNNISFPSDRIRTRFRIDGFQVTVPGKYYCEISAKESAEKEMIKFAELPIVVKIV